MGWDDPVEEGMATHSSFLEKPHGQRKLVGYSSWCCNELDTTEATKHTHTFYTDIIEIDLKPRYVS